jgi:hypothetical protein
VPINDTHVFVHVPKTGGQSIVQLMGVDPYKPNAEQLTGMVDGVQLSHLTAAEIAARIGQQRGRKWFAVVRNPWDRLVSEYAYRIKQGVFKYMPGKPTFREFIRFVTLCRSDRMTDAEGGRHLLPQLVFVCDRFGGLLVDAVYHFEELHNIGPAEFGRATPHVNATQHAPFWTWYDQETESLVGARFFSDVVLSHAKSPSQIKAEI